MMNLVRLLAIAGAAALVSSCTKSTEPKMAKTPAAIITVDTVAALSGTVATLDIKMAKGHSGQTGIDSLSGFDFLLSYDETLLSFLGPPQRGSNTSEWEYFTWRTETVLPSAHSKLGLIRLLAIRDLDNGTVPSPPQYSLTGVIVSLQFSVDAYPTMIGDSIEIGFCRRAWSDNSLSIDGNEHIVFTPDTTLGSIPYVAGYDTTPAPQLYDLQPVLQLQSGWVRIAQPKETSIGDVDLNGIPFQIHDAVVFVDFFRMGYAAFDPQRASEQISETDCDHDGEPLTRADLRSMIRLIGGQAPAVDTVDSPYTDTLKLSPFWDGHRYVISCQSTIQIDQLWLSISGPAPGGTVYSLAEPPAIISNSVSNAQLHVACGTVDGKHVFGPELGARFAIQGYNGHSLDIKAQASRYPGVSMVVRVGPFVGPEATRSPMGGSNRIP